ncbi:MULTISPECIES: DUF3955 domain-containing protein [Yersinia pseudotuberculosis complex]|uniref:DUF3955 domain-containing protein n=2 Tax=Yersinia pseudotuberculosis complex TaxID=1649845 RepID=A0A380Q8B7_YERPU|nr:MULTISPECIES: DUF3955 domain-containing protein [Yersinia pseudotuberculosis complex]CND12739.1 Uncharacterised protein [Yersinia pseudotuberculosis]CRG48568.1 Uncharacterised protein [Yersinia wautersii]SUP82131.1 Uncharacterised protein [Yersinia pseudotuberculosis]
MVKKLSLFIFTLFGLTGLGCFISKALAGSYIDEDGVLHEPFFLIPLGYLFLLVALIALITFLIAKYKERDRFKL